MPPAVFYPLTVSAVDRLTADAAALTFAVPPDLRETFAFQPGPVADCPAGRRAPVLLDLRPAGPRAAHRRARGAGRRACPAGWSAAPAPAT